LNFGASGTLMVQIRRGAPVDLFISAADEQVQQLIQSGLADAASRQVLAGNSLVLITGAKTNAAISWSSLTEPSVHKVAIGDPQNVPAGMYAMQTLRALGMATPLKDKLVYGQNVRQVLVYVQRHEVDAGIVYHSDAVAAGKTVRIVAVVPETSHDPIEYSAVVLHNSAQRCAAEAFLDYLTSSPAQDVLMSYGFSPPPAVAMINPAVPPVENTGTVWPALRLSLAIASTATVLAVLVGVFLAYVISRRQFSGRSAIESLICLPLVLPPTVVGYLLIVALGADSWVGRLLHYSVVFRIEGAILAAATVALPLVYIPSRSAFSSVDRELEDVARLMGANALQTFWHLSLPMARRGIAGGLVLGFARALGEFGATMMVFGMQPQRLTLPISIYADFQSLTLRHAVPAVALLIGVSAGIMLIYNLVIREHPIRRM